MLRSCRIAEGRRIDSINNCFNSPRCTSITAHLGGIGFPADACSLFADVFVISVARFSLKQFGDLVPAFNSPDSVSCFLRFAMC